MWRGSSIAISCGCGSLTFTIMSAALNTAAASGRIVAPAFSKALVRAIDAVAGVGLNEHLVAVGDQLGDRSRRQSDAIFVDLDLFWHPDTHLFVRSAHDVCAGL